MWPVRSRARGRGSPFSMKAAAEAVAHAPRSPVYSRQVYDFSAATQGSLTLRASSSTESRSHRTVNTPELHRSVNTSTRHLANTIGICYREAPAPAIGSGAILITMILSDAWWGHLGNETDGGLCMSRRAALSAPGCRKRPDPQPADQGHRAHCAQERRTTELANEPSLTGIAYCICGHARL